MSRSIALLLAGTLLFQSAGAARAGEDENARLRERVAELEKKVGELEALTGTISWTASRLELQRKQREKLVRRMDEIRAGLLAAGDGAKDAPELAELLALADHDDQETRLYLVTTLARLPRELGGTTLAAMVADLNMSVGEEAIKTMGILEYDGAVEAIAARADALILTRTSRYATTASSSKHSFFVAACSYLVRNGDPRGVGIFVAQLEREIKHAEVGVATRMVASRGLMNQEYLKAVDKWTGGRADFLPERNPRMGGHFLRPGEGREAARKLIAWWQENGKGFKVPDLDAPAEAADPGAEAF